MSRTAEALYEPLIAAHPGYSLVAVDPTVDAAVPLAKICALPFAGDIDMLPADGYDAVLRGAAADLIAGRTPALVSAVEAVVRPDVQGRGLSTIMLNAVRRHLAGLGHTSLVVPVRPNAKHLHPDVAMADYVTWTDAAGLPADPWLRVHARCGGRVVGLAPHSMTVTGSLDRWREWTGLPFDQPGPVRVPQALVPVHCFPSADTAVYVEPNVWVHHTLA
jgi:GNAT superfamily N-acetyltransferase